MPWKAVIPASTSAMEAPTRKGGPSGQAHETALPLDHRVVAGAAAPGTVGAIARDRGIHEPRVAAGDLVVREPQPVEGAGPEVLDQYVRRLQQSPEDLAAARILE